MPKLNVKQNNSNVIKAFQVALETGHRNLLDNPWFTVNQRGASGAVASGGYAADRWFVGGASTVTRNADGTITLNGTSSYASLTQRLEESLINFLVGKTVTMSLLYSDGTVFSGTVYAYANRENAVYIDGTTNFFVLDTRASRRWYIYLNGLKKTLTAVKLELGSYSTLANDVPPDYEEELRKCMYYFRRISNTSGYTQLWLLGRNRSTTGADFYGVLGNQPMRTAPTISRSGSIYVQNADTNIAITDLTRYFTVSSDFVFRATVASGLTANAPCALALGSGAYIDLSADL